MKWNIERTKDKYHADKHIDCGFGFTFYLDVTKEIEDKHTPYRWGTTLFKDWRDVGYQMTLQTGRARTANDAKRQAECVLMQFVNAIVKK